MDNLVISAHGESKEIALTGEDAVAAMLDWLEQTNAADWTNDGRTVHGIHRTDGQIDREATARGIRAVYGIEQPTDESTDG